MSPYVWAHGQTHRGSQRHGWARLGPCGIRFPAMAVSPSARAGTWPTRSFTNHFSLSLGSPSFSRGVLFPCILYSAFSLPPCQECNLARAQCPPDPFTGSVKGQPHGEMVQVVGSVHTPGRREKTHNGSQPWFRKA